MVVLTESFWRSRFNADPGIVGRSLRLDGDPWTVIGIVPDAAQVIGRASMWALSTAGFRRPRHRMRDAPRTRRRSGG